MSHPILTRTKCAGFTLIEMLCAIVVSCILSSVAYPTYQGAIHKSRRADALASMIAVQLAEERFRSNNLSYGTLHDVGIASTSPSHHYTLSVLASAESGYQVLASAMGTQSSDSICRHMKMIVEGNDIRHASGSDTTLSNPEDVNRQCWRM